ncbi:MAG: hypothetical protein Q8R88_10905 [Desulfoprunum sp.]|nr:hypothetical protein [Desulfoprunum sp.]
MDLEEGSDGVVCWNLKEESNEIEGGLLHFLRGEEVLKRGRILRIEVASAAVLAGKRKWQAEDTWAPTV